jgi:hypothetical protein
VRFSTATHVYPSPTFSAKAVAGAATLTITPHFITTLSVTTLGIAITNVLLSVVISVFCLNVIEPRSLG